MKKVRQVSLLLTALGLLPALSCGRAGAKEVSGTILDGFSWAVSALRPNGRRWIRSGSITRRKIRPVKPHDRFTI